MNILCLYLIASYASPLKSKLLSAQNFNTNDWSASAQDCQSFECLPKTPDCTCNEHWLSQNINNIHVHVIVCQ